MGFEFALLVALATSPQMVVKWFGVLKRPAAVQASDAIGASRAVDGSLHGTRRKLPQSFQLGSTPKVDNEGQVSNDVCVRCQHLRGAGSIGKKALM